MKATQPRVIIRPAETCPHCRTINTIRIDRAFRENGDERVAYGYCKDCGGRVVVREVRKVHSQSM